MDLKTIDTHQRRGQRVSFTTTIEEDPACPPSSLSESLFQKHYRLEGRLACTFWANSAQMDKARDRAEKVLRHHLYRDAIGVLHDMELAVEEMDQEQLRRACLDMRDLFVGS